MASHIAGLRIKAMINAFFAGQFDVALAYHEQLQPLFEALFATTNPIPVKAALEIAGWPVGPPRSPLISLNTEMRNALSTIIDALSQT